MATKKSSRPKIPKGYEANPPSYKLVQETNFYKPLKEFKGPRPKTTRPKPMEVTVVSIRGNKGLSKRKRGR